MGSDQTTTPVVVKAFQVAQATKFPRWFSDLNPKTTGLVADVLLVPTSENWDEESEESEG